MNEGSIALNRSIVKWEWYQDANTMRVFVHLLLLAQWQDTRYRGKEILRGQLWTGRKKIATDLGLTEREVRTALKHLQSTGEIEIEAFEDGSLISVKNYNFFQTQNVKKTTNQMTNEMTNKVTNEKISTNGFESVLRELEDDKVTNKVTNEMTNEVTIKRPTNDQQVTTYNNINKVNKDNNIKTYTRFTPPSVDEVKAYCEERRNGIDAESFIAYYQSRGWKDIKDWRACVITWEKRRRQSETEITTDYDAIAKRQQEKRYGGL